MPTLGRGLSVAPGERPGDGTHTPETLVSPPGGHFHPVSHLPSSPPSPVNSHTSTNFISTLIFNIKRQSVNKVYLYMANLKYLIFKN